MSRRLETMNRKGSTPIRKAFGAMLAAWALSAGTPARADGHPHFDSQGMTWFTRWQDALDEASKTGRPILIEYGREA